MSVSEINRIVVPVALLFAVPLSVPGSQPKAAAEEEAVAVDEDWTTGEKSLLFVRVVFSDLPNINWTVEEAEEELAKVAEFLEENSYGRYELEPTVFPEVIEMPREASTYSGRLDLFRDAVLRQVEEYDEEQEEPGMYDPENFDLDIIGFPQNRYFPTAISRIGDPGMWLNGFFGHQLILHEIGHNLGLRHANYWHPSDDEPAGEGQHIEYEDLFDSMGRFPHPTNHYNPAFKTYLGWLGGEDVLEVEESGVYRLYRHDHPDAADVRAIFFSRDEEKTYWLSLCRDSLEKEGIGIRWGPEPGEMVPHGTRLLNMRPGSDLGVHDYPLRIGETFYDAERRLTVRLLELGGEEPHEYADIEILIETPPTIVEAPEAQPTFAGESVTLSVEASGPGPLTYRWFKDGELIPSEDDSTLTIDELQTLDRGAYTVEVSNPFDSAVSEPVDLMVYPAGYRIPGTLDRSFDPGEGVFGHIRNFAEEEDGAVLAAGSVREYDGMEVNGVVRIFPDGSPDPDFLPVLEDEPWAWGIAVQSDGRILVGGDFTAIDGVPRPRIARLQPDGSLDPSFDPKGGADDTVKDFFLLEDGRILVQGDFTEFDGHASVGLVRLMPNGDLDPSFDPLPASDNSRVTGAVLMRDGTITVTGEIETPNGTTKMARLLSDGRLDDSFYTGAFTDLSWGSIQDIVVEQDDGHILGIGRFGTTEGDAYGDIFRVQPEGALDSSFSSVPVTGTKHDLALLPNRRILVGGGFLSYAGHSRPRIIRLEPDGEVDRLFAPWEGPQRVRDDGSTFSGNVSVIQQLRCGRSILYGTFNQYDGIPRPRIARIYGDMEHSFFQNWLVKHDIPPGQDEPDSDPGDHGIPNLLRYAFSLNPHKPERSLLPSIVVEDGQDKDLREITVTFRRLRLAEDIQYVIERSTDLLFWEEVTFELDNVHSHGEFVETVTKSKALEGEAPRAFYRIRVVWNLETN